MSDQLTIFARITPKPEYLDDARSAVLGIVQATRAEPGCRAFQLHDDWNGKGRLHIYEVWDDEAGLIAHHNQPYTQAVFDSYREWLSEPVEINTLRQVHCGE